MRTLGKLNWPFPDYGTDEAHQWVPNTIIRPLATRVLCVAKTRVEGAWAAYCDAVPGMSHDAEAVEVLHTGQKMFEQHARAVFPEFEGVPYAR